MHITMIIKKLAYGSPCPKCQEVAALLEKRGYGERINRTLIANPQEPDNEAMQLVKKHKIKRAPFFIVQKDDGSEAIYDSALRLIHELLSEE